MKSKKVTLHTGQELEYREDKEMQGGMKRVYFSVDRSSVVCFFKSESDAKDPQRVARLEAIIGKYNPTTDQTTGEYFKRFFCWPSSMVIRPALGVVCPVYPKNFLFATGPSHIIGKEKQGSWFSSPKLRKMLPDAELGDWLGYLKVCQCIARGVRRLHNAGLAHSDLSDKNVLIDPVGGSAIIIDIDSLVVPGVFAPDVIGTPGYIAPEVIGTQDLHPNDPKRILPSRTTDLHALAVLVYQYLFFRHPLRGTKINSPISAEEDERLTMGPKALFIEHPQDPSNRKDPKTKKIVLRGLHVTYDSVGPYLAPLFNEAFIDGLHNPNARPSANKWEDALFKTADLLMQCKGPACKQKWFVYSGSSPVQCPFCGWIYRGTFPILRFYKEVRPGNFMRESYDYQLVVRENQGLFSWHVYDHLFPNEYADRTILGYFIFHNGKWLLRNDGCDSMVVVNGPHVPIGSHVELSDNRQIRLSTASHGRLAVVRLISSP